MAETERFKEHQAASRKTGTERFLRAGKPTGATVLDFWQWAFSDLQDNTMRGMVAEYVVGRALGGQHPVCRGWLPYDLDTPKGIKVEVKSSAYVQGWMQRRMSRIEFGIAPKRAWNPATGELDVEARRHADVYVFCLLAEKDPESTDPLNLDQWEFYVLARSVLDREIPDQKTIAFSRLSALGAERAPLESLADSVIRCAGTLGQ